MWINLWVAGKLCDPALTPAIPERLRGDSIVMKRYTNVLFTLLTLLAMGTLSLLVGSDI